MPNVHAFPPECEIGKRGSGGTEERIKLHCSPGAKPDRADFGEARQPDRVKERTTSATNEYASERKTKKTSYNGENEKSHQGGAAATQQHQQSKRAKKAASKRGRRSHGGSRASSADEYDDDLYDSETEDGAWGPRPADETTKSEPNRDVLRGIRMGQLDVSTAELERAIDLLCREPSKSEEARKQIEDEINEIVLSALVDNRNFINIEVNGETYRALLDPGATLSLAGARIADRFKGRLRESST